jgi:hypothetical protein
MRPIHVAVSWLLLATLWSWSAPAPAADPDPVGEELRSLGIEPTSAGVRTFLTQMQVSPQQETKLRALIRNLGSDDFETRQQATRQLLAQPYLPPALLNAPYDDLEIRQRLEAIRNEPPHRDHEMRLHLVLLVIDGQGLHGFTGALLDLLPQQDEDTRNLATRAIAASAEAADLPALRAALAPTKPRPIRQAAAAALGPAGGQGAEKELLALLQDGDALVRLSAATGLLNLDHRAALDALVGLLEADQADIRQKAANLLTEASGRHVDFDGSDNAEQRAEGVAAWRAWAMNEGRTAALNLPVGRNPPWRGRIVIGVYEKKQLREIDAVTGKTILEVNGFTYPWGCHATPAGHRLIAEFQRREVVEYDLSGKECWRKSVPGTPTGVQRLPNGRTLVALSDANKIVELDRQGKVVWEINLEGRPTTAQRLADGRTLVSLQDAGKVVAIDREGHVCWEIGGMQRPHTAEMLANGHVLVCEFNRRAITEYTRSGKVAWRVAGLNNPAQGQRLPNGNTLISTSDGLMEYNPQGKVIRRFDVGRTRFFAY